MKKYKRKTPLFSPLKTAIAALFAAIATAMIIVFAGTDNEWCIICGAITETLFIGDLFIIIGASSRYRYSNKCIKVYYQLFSYKKLDYSWFSAIVISNASYNNGYGYGANGNIPMQYRVKGNNGHIKVTFPFITLHKPQYPVDKIKEGMNSRDLYMLDYENIFCLGICWFDSLTELLDNTDISLYILEDVYFRFKGMFDSVLIKYGNDINRFYIVGEVCTGYKDYLNGKELQENSSSVPPKD